MIVPAEETNPLRLAWHAARITYEDLFTFVAVSLLTWLSLGLVVPAFPASVALCELARLALEAYAVKTRHWWDAMREYFARAWVVGLLTTVITLVLLANVWFYSRQTGFWRYGTIFWLWMLGIWALAVVYVMPLTALQEERRPWRLVRNAFFLAVLRPFHTLVALLWVLTITALSILFPLFLLVLPAYVAVYTTLLARQLILDIQRRHKETEGDRE